jgi:hypothetical protein
MSGLAAGANETPVVAGIGPSDVQPAAPATTAANGRVAHRRSDCDALAVSIFFWSMSRASNYRLPALALCLLSGGCVSQATVPTILPAADANARQDFYAKYALQYESGFWSKSWRRADGEYGWGALEDLAKGYPETNDLYGRANTRGIVIGSVAGAGGALVGYTLGYNLTAQESQRWSSGTQAAMYGAGGGLILVAFIIEAAWRNPAEDFATAYNANLRKSLGLPATGVPGATSLRLTIDPNGLGVAF